MNRMSISTHTDSSLDSHLLEAFRAGDEAAFATLSERYRQPIAAICERQAPPGETDDCIQAVFLVLSRRPAAAARAPVLLAWLHRVAHFVCRDARRAAKRRKQMNSVAGQTPPVGNAPEAAVLDQLDAALLRLEERQRAAVLLHASGNANDDIAKSLGVTSANASKLVQRGLAALRDCLIRRGAPISAAVLLTLITTKHAAAATTVPLTMSALTSATLNANVALLAKGTLMHLSMTATTTWVIASSIAATICVGGLVASDVLTPSPKPMPLPPPAVSEEQQPTPVPKPVVKSDPNDLSALLKKKITFDFVDVGAADVLSFLRKITNLNIIVHPKAMEVMEKTPITLKAQDMSMEALLNILTEQWGVRHLQIDEAVFITRLPADDNRLFETTEKLLTDVAVIGEAKETEWGKRILEKLDQRVTFSFEDNDLSESIVFIQAVTAANFVINPEVLANSQPAVTIKVKDMTLRHALNHMMRITNLRFQLRNEAVIIDKLDAGLKAEKKLEDLADGIAITLKVKDMRSEDAAKWIGQLSDLSITVDPRLKDKRLSFSFEDAPLRDTINFLAQVLDAEIQRPNGAILLVPKAPKEDAQPVLPHAPQ